LIGISPFVADFLRIGAGDGLFPQTHSVAPATTFARVQTRNFCVRKRPSFLVFSTACSEKPVTASRLIIWNYYSLSIKPMQIR